MNEYILEFGDALYNEETGEAVFNPTYKGELIRCKDCKYMRLVGNTWRCQNRLVMMLNEQDDYCSRAERKEE